MRTAREGLFDKALGGLTTPHLDDLQQLVAVDAAAAVDVVEFEVPAQLLLHAPLQHEAQGGHVLHKVNEAVLQWDTHSGSSIRTHILSVCREAAAQVG